MFFFMNAKTPLIVYDKSTYALVLFHYSCSDAIDGFVLEEPEKFDLSHLDLYDPCNKFLPYKRVHILVFLLIFKNVPN